MENQTDATAAESTPGLGSGLGWGWDKERRMVALLFEGDGLGVAYDDNPCPAGVKIALGPFAEKIPTVAECEELVAIFVREGIPEMPGITLTPITWEKYVAEGYNED